MMRSHGALAAAVLLSFMLGSIHAFSLFIAPLEAELAAGRSEVSLVYSLALLCLTGAVLVGHRLFSRLSPAVLAGLVGIAGASGLMIAAIGQSLWQVILGYSLLYGAANGLGYGFCLQMGGRALPARAGFAMGLVTAVYALGAASFATLLDLVIAAGGAALGFAVLAVSLLVVAALSAALFRWSRVEAVADRAAVSAGAIGFDRLFWLLWSGYGLAVAAGLMALGHAAGIVAAAGGTPAQVLAGAMLIALGNALGGFAVAAIADRVPPGRLLWILPLLSALALAGQAAVDGGLAALIGLALIGVAYGAIIAVTPYAVARFYGASRYPAAYGRIFTAWGLAGLIAPVFAGLLYDLGGSYRVALVTAAVAAGGASAIAFLLDAKDAPPTRP